MRITTLRITKRGKVFRRDAEAFELAMTTRKAPRFERTVNINDAELAVETLERAIAKLGVENVTSVRIYAGGWVPNSYGFSCPMEWIDVDRQEDGTFTATIGEGDARRSGGTGPWGSINSRNVEQVLGS